MSEPSDHASNGSNLISATNNQESFIAEIRFEPLNTRSDSSKVRSTVLRTLLIYCIAPSPNSLKVLHLGKN
ncbi:hypothetical protein RHMOL_Rhmol04G0244500 [Rhododendron molle]|uniref:Uncharacterized protein n=1 Tax=Rhododendron molle TaxID=49168 RepID=A0ACC0P3S7_RHOML|nr:hypothetical protein RHMOL_Rhmol04G0244500 [Rhododendron molle]